MGADIRGAGTDVIKIYGVEHLHGTTYSIIPDQIEAGTYMVAIAATGGDAVIENVIPKHLESISAKLEEMGVIVEEFDDSIRIKRDGQLQKCNVKQCHILAFQQICNRKFLFCLQLHRVPVLLRKVFGIAVSVM